MMMSLCTIPVNSFDWVDVLGVVVDGNGDDVVAVRLVAWVVELRYIRVPQRLLRGDPLAGVELQQPDEQVLRLR